MKGAKKKPPITEKKINNPLYFKDAHINKLPLDWASFEKLV